LSRDLPRSGSKSGDSILPVSLHPQDSLPVSGRSRDKPRSYAFGKIKNTERQAALVLAFDLHTQKVQTPQNATWVQA
jgi:hypothetical protein